MKAVCNKCGRSFKVVNKKRWLSDNIQEIFFRCRHCKTEYRVCLTNAYIRKLQKKIDSTVEALEKAKLIKELKKEMDNLNRR